MTELPVGWNATTLGHVVQLQGGSTPKGVLVAPAGVDIPFYKVSDMNSSNGAFMSEARVTLSTQTAAQLSLRVFAPGAVIFPKVGGALHTNKKRILTRPAAVDTNTMVVVPTAAHDPRFLYHWLSNITLADYAYGAPVPQVSRSRLSEVPFALPPLAEQRRIVVAIEERLSHLDAAASSLSEVSPRLTQFRQSLLRDAFDIRWERVPITFVTSAERVIRYGILKPGKDVPGGVPVVKVRDYPDGEIRVDSLMRTTPEISARFEGATLRPGDILISIRGTYGRVAPVPDVLARANITQDSARVAPLPLIHRGFLVHFLRSQESQSFLRRVARGVAVKGVNLRDLRQLPVPVPDLATQVRVAERLDGQLSLHDNLSGELAKARRATEALRYSILDAAFSGRLVLQDPNEESGSLRLERVEAERAAGTRTKREQKATAS
jgi:type I restriction enzyme S subunit